MPLSFRMFSLLAGIGLPTSAGLPIRFDQKLRTQLGSQSKASSLAFSCKVFAALLLTAACTAASYAESPTDLELYGRSSLAGLHSHPLTSEGRKLEAAEESINRRRAAIKAWLACREGADVPENLDRQIQEEVGEVLWSGNITVGDEWRRIRAARHALEKLEQRKLAAERLYEGAGKSFPCRG